MFFYFVYSREGFWEWDFIRVIKYSMGFLVSSRFGGKSRVLFVWVRRGFIYFVLVSCYNYGDRVFYKYVM